MSELVRLLSQELKLARGRSLGLALLSSILFRLAQPSSEFRPEIFIVQTGRISAAQ
jgi:hypothetical protein